MSHRRVKSERDLTRAGAWRFIVLVGVVSLFSDMAYEGARSISGPFLGMLSASAVAVGVVAGLGEFLGYALRLGSGYLADRTGKYWPLTIWGYGLNLLAVPLLALAGNWEVAAVLLVAERAGKGIRTPARDAMLSHAAVTVGRGWGFGFHAAMDQVGALVGPLLVAAVLYFHGSYRHGFAVLLAPAILALAVLAAAARLYPHPQHLEVATPEPAATKFLRRPFWLYTAAGACLAAGFADFSLIAYHFQRAAVLPTDWIPLFYAVAMAVDALAALILGRLFDRLGLPVLVGAPVLSAFAAPLVFLGGSTGALLGMILWGLGMGVQGSIVRAALVEMVPPQTRATGYGIFHTVFGLFWFLGSALMGFLYDLSLASLAIFSVALQLLAIPLFLRVSRNLCFLPGPGSGGMNGGKSSG
jgi:MFS family permease